MAIFEKLFDYKNRVIRPFLAKYAADDYREGICDANGKLLISAILTAGAAAIGTVVLTAGSAIVGWFRIKRAPLHLNSTGTGLTLRTLAPGAAFRLLGFRLHISTGAPLAAAETLTVTVVSGLGTTEYDVVLYSQDLGTASINDVDLDYEGEAKFFQAADAVVFALSANAGGDTWGCETIYELV